MRKTLKILGLLGIAFFLFVVLALTVHRKVDVAFPNGGSVKLRAASVLESIGGSKCEIEIKSRSGKESRISLRQDWFDGPVMVLETTNDNVFLCIYDHDIDFQLLRIDLDRKFVPPPPQVVMSSSILTSTCKIERAPKGDLAEWTEAVAAIEKMSPGRYRCAVNGLELGIFSLHTTKATLLNSLKNFGDQGQYPGDVFIPAYMQMTNTGGSNFSR